MADSSEDLLKEAGHHEPLGDLGRNPSAFQVEALILVDGTNRGCMGAPDVVIQNLKVWHRLGPCRIGQLDVSIGLGRVGTASVLGHANETRVHGM